VNKLRRWLMETHLLKSELHMSDDDRIAEEVVRRRVAGALDGRLNEELGKLSYEQLLIVSRLLAVRRLEVPKG
jgi:hypothetical protein